MRSSTSSNSSANLEGALADSSNVREEVIDRAPPEDPQGPRGAAILPPQASLKPSHFTSNWQRWTSVAAELAGKKSRQQLGQVGTIALVITLRTLLQVCPASVS